MGPQVQKSAAARAEELASSESHFPVRFLKKYADLEVQDLKAEVDDTGKEFTKEDTLNVTYAFESLDFDQLQSDDSVKDAMLDAVMDGVLAGLPPGYDRSNIQVVVRRGSVIIEIIVRP